MKIRRWIAAALTLFLSLRLIPGFAGKWARWISQPALNALACMGDRLPFPLAEWLGIAVGILLALALFVRSLRRAAGGLLIALMIACLALWYPLYFVDCAAHSASTRQISASCAELIAQLNACAAEFELPDDLPAKPVRFPGWMRALDISGVCAFFTGEALYSPELHPAALPFVAVHERMHLEGHAGEGAANIAAWEACITRGGAYADSARLWALRYSMGLLEPAQRSAHVSAMRPHTLERYRASGGAYISAPPAWLSALQRFLGVGGAMSDYEILALYLAEGYSR